MKLESLAGLPDPIITVFCGGELRTGKTHRGRERKGARKGEGTEEEGWKGKGKGKGHFGISSPGFHR